MNNPSDLVGEIAALLHRIRADGTPGTIYKPDPAEHGYADNYEYFKVQYR